MHPRDIGLLSIVKHMKYKRKQIGAPRLEYCSISWSHIIAWTRKVTFRTRLDTIAFAVISLAFTTIRRIGSFLPRDKKESREFSWILPSFIQCNESRSTMLIWLPRVKTDPEGRDTDLTVKSTRDSGCPQQFVRSLLDSRSNNGPLFCHLEFVPTQAWALKWIRARMTELAKDPR